MEADSIRTHAYLEIFYWWWVGRRRIIAKILGKYLRDRGLQILDWGCGTGGNFPVLAKFGQVLGVDSSDEALKFCREKGIANLQKAGNLSEFLQQVPNAQFHLVCAFDVLEHIPNDFEFLEGLCTLLRSGGYVMVTVPAYQFLWSELDDQVGHVRRYTKKELIEKLKKAGFEIVKASYFVLFMFVPIVIFRLMGKMTGRAKKPQFTFVEFPKPINWLLTKTLDLEAAVLPRVNFPFGTSIIALARKKS